MLDAGLRKATGREANLYMLSSIRNLATSAPLRNFGQVISESEVFAIITIAT